MSSNIGLQPVTSMQRSIFSVATSLTSSDTKLPNWLTVDPKRALQNGLAIISGSSVGVNTFTAIIFGFGSLSAGFYLYIWKNVPLRAAIRWVSSKFNGSVSIASSHPLNKDVLTYLEKKRLGPQANSLALVNPNAGPTMSEMIRTMYEPRASYPPPRSGHKQIEPEPEKLEYIPISGTYVFWHNGYRMTLARHEEVTGFYQDDGKFVRTQNGPTDLSRGQTLTITCWSFGGGVQPVKDFLEHVRETTKPAKQNTTTIFRASCNKEHQKFHWDIGVNRPARTVDSIALESGKKQSLMKECMRYFSKEDERFHALRGIPYRRGLLFYGPPGTGKTSFTVALAGHFKLNVYMISMSDDALNDRGLGALFDTLPRRCIVLLEDIDSSGIDREARKEKITSSRDPTKVKRTILVGVTLSGLLNVLDGPASVDGRLVVMTSNSPDALDAALLRPGRIDSKILFGYTTKEVSAQIFGHIFNKTLDEIVLDTDETVAHPSPEELTSMAEQFADCIPETKISPAECQGYLMRHRDDPHAALSNAKAWATEILKVKEKGNNVADFDNEIKRGGALFAGRGTHRPPNGTTAPVPSRSAHETLSRLRERHNLMIPTGMGASDDLAPQDAGAGDYDSGNEEIVAYVPPTHPNGHGVCMMPPRSPDTYVNGNGVNEHDDYDDMEGSASAA
jgi:chaperone BCS1